MFYPSVKFHEYIPYGLGLIAMTHCFCSTGVSTHAQTDRGKELWPGNRISQLCALFATYRLDML